MRTTIRIQLVHNVPAGAHGGEPTVSIGRLIGEDGRELACPFDEEREFVDLAEVRAELGAYFGPGFRFVEA